MMLVSVVVPTYNPLSLPKETVDSVLAQTHPDWELLIVFDGSSDRTEDWVLNQLKREPRIKLVNRREHRPDAHGSQVCRNLGLFMAGGESVVFLDSDDLLAPDCLYRRLALFDAEPTIDAVVGQGLHFRAHPGDFASDNVWGQ